jgi:hypothetical protein
MPSTEPPGDRASSQELVGIALTCLAVIGMSLVPAALIACRPADPRSVAAVFPPWWPPARAFSAASASGRLAAVATVPWIVVVRGDVHLPSQLRASGALLLLDPKAALGCTAVPQESS